MSEAVTLRFEGPLGVLTLNRPEVSNAFNAEMISEICQHFETITSQGEACRALVIKGAGKHFSGGADLEWMKRSSELGYDENLAEADKLSVLFASLCHLPVPTLAVVHGAAFGGAVGLVACCDFAIALDDAKFCLSEVRVGVVAAVILPYLADKMSPGQLRRYVLTGRVFTSREALDSGLVQRTVSQGRLDEALREELELLLKGSPTAQRTFKSLHQGVQKGPFDHWKLQQKTMVETIARMRVSPSGQKGMQAFLTKSTPDWVAALPKDWKLK